MRTHAEKQADYAAHVREAVNLAKSVREARALLREAGFAPRQNVLFRAWKHAKRLREPGSLFDVR